PGGRARRLLRLRSHGLRHPPPPAPRRARGAPLSRLVVRVGAVSGAAGRTFDVGEQGRTARRARPRDRAALDLRALHVVAARRSGGVHRRLVARAEGGRASAAVTRAPAPAASTRARRLTRATPLPRRSRCRTASGSAPTAAGSSASRAG